MATAYKPKKITALPEATTLDGSEYFPIAQSGVTRKVLASVVSDFLGQATEGGGVGGPILEYIDDHDAATLASANFYADTQDAEVLQQAMAYTDANSGAGGVSQTYVDDADAATIDSANSYTDSHIATQAATTLASAQAFATAADVTNLNAAKAYADTLVVGLATTSAMTAADTSILNQAKAYADSVGGGSGTYTTGGSSTNLAPGFSGGGWTFQGTTPPTISGGVLHFSGSANLAEARVSAVLKDNTTYTVAVTMANYVSGSARVILHGPTTNHQGATTAINTNGVTTFTITTTGTSSLTNLIRIQATGSANPNTYDITAISVTEGTGGVGISRPVNSKIKEIETSVIDYGADPTGASDSTNAFNNAIASGAQRVHVPAGTYKVSNLVIAKHICIYGDGRSKSIVNCTTTTTHGVWCADDPSISGDVTTTSLIRMERIQFKYTGTGQALDKHGIYITTKVYFDEVFANKFTGTGFMFASSTPGDVNGSVFHAHLLNCWAWDNGLDGCDCGFGANNNLFTNCNFNRSGRYGFWHHTGNTGRNETFVGAATYCNTVVSGEAAYNTGPGWMLESGDRLTTIGIYSEGNCRNQTTDTGYANSPFADVQVGSGISGEIGIGNVNGPATTRIVVPSTYIQDLRVTYGGRNMTPVANTVASVTAANASNAPAGGTGTAAGGWSTAADRDAAIATINALVTLGNANKVAINNLLTSLRNANVIKT